MKAEKISEILDNHLPPDGVGTEREKLRMLLMNELIIASKQENAELKKHIAYFAYWYENMKGNTDAFTMSEFEQILYPEFLKDYNQKFKNDENSNNNI
jgi:hypothetical protein